MSFWLAFDVFVYYLWRAYGTSCRRLRSLTFFYKFLLLKPPSYQTPRYDIAIATARSVGSVDSQYISINVEQLVCQLQEKSEYWKRCAEFIYLLVDMFRFHFWFGAAVATNQEI